MTYGVSESTASTIVSDVKDHFLIKSKQFSLPKKIPTAGTVDWDIVIANVTKYPYNVLKK